MEQEWTHDQGTATRSNTDNFALCFPSEDGSFREDKAVDMRAGHDTQRTIAGRAIVDMQPNCHELLQQMNRRLDEKLTLLLRPPPKRGVGYARGHWNAEVLMDSNKPVALTRLVEVGALRGNEGARNEWCKRGMISELLGKGSAPNVREKASCSRGASSCACSVCRDTHAFFVRKHPRYECEAVVGERVTFHTSGGLTA